MFLLFLCYLFESVKSWHDEREKMATIKADLSPELKEKYAYALAQKLEDGGKLLISITHCSKSNMSYRYKVSVLGIDRYFWAAYNIGLTLKEYDLIEDPYEIANRRTYQEI